MAGVTQITGGEITVSERIKTGDFEHREAKATLRFDVAESSGYEDVFDQATGAAQAQVQSVLTGKIVKLSRGAARRLPNVAAEVAISEPAVEAKAKVIAAAAGALEVPEDPTGSVETAGQSQATASASVADGPPAEEWEAAQPEVTDKMMTDACAEHNARLQREGSTRAPAQIKEVIYKYVPVGKVSRDIPQNQRREFINALEALKANG